MKPMEGICRMCGSALMITTLDGRKRPLCPDCVKKAERVVENLLRKQGKKKGKKGFVFPKIQ